MSTAPTSQERCIECGRNPRTINSDMSECSVVECPHRPKCWADGTGHPRWEKPRRGPGEPFDRLFDPVKP